MTRDTRMLVKALEQRWPISPTARKAIVSKLLQVITNPNSKPREIIAASRGLLAAEAQNQADEHKIVDVRIHDKITELDAIASELGVDLRVVEDAERSREGGAACIEVDGRSGDKPAGG